MYLPSSQLSIKPTTAQIRAAIWEASHLAAGRSRTGFPAAPLSDEERALMLADIAKMEAMLPAAELRELNPARAKMGRLSPAARRGLRRWRRVYGGHAVPGVQGVRVCTIPRSSHAFEVVGPGPIQNVGGQRRPSEALRLALRPHRPERWAIVVAATNPPGEW